MTPPRPPLLALLLGGVLSASCATSPRPQVLDESSRVAASEPVDHAKQWAPQAHARAEQLRTKAAEAHDDGDTQAAAALANHAIAAYQRALVLARLAQAEHRIAGAKQELAELQEQRDSLRSAQQAVAVQVQRLELEYKVARDAEPLEPIDKADPKREAARRVAARSIIESARLLCLAAKVAGGASDDVQSATVSQLETQLGALEQRLESSPAPTPIDEAYRLRSDCLRAVTRLRDQRRAEAPANDPSDVLLTRLSESFPASPPFRDDRGVVVTLTSPFDDGGGLTPGAITSLSHLAEVSAQNTSFEAMLVLHGKPSTSRTSNLKQWVEKQPGLEAAIVHDAETRLPASAGHVAGTPAESSRIEFVFVPR